MKILSKIKINNLTYLFLILCALCGYLKNISIIFFICIWHECGHIFFLRLFNYEIIEIELAPFGGITTTNKRINSSINKEIIINIGGILNQIILFLILLLLKNHLNIITYNLFMFYNFTILIFNILPIISLDGNNIIHLLLEKIFSYNLSYKMNYIISSFSLIIFLIINYQYNIDNYFIIIFLFIKSIVYIRNYRHLKNKFLLERYINDFEYKKIDNKTQTIKQLRKEVKHYFKENDKYVSEEKMIAAYLHNNKI